MANQTSIDLLTSILGMLGSIAPKIDTISASVEKNQKNIDELVDVLKGNITSPKKTGKSDSSSQIKETLNTSKKITSQLDKISTEIKPDISTISKNISEISTILTKNFKSLTEVLKSSTITMVDMLKMISTDIKEKLDIINVSVRKADDGLIEEVATGVITDKITKRNKKWDALGDISLSLEKLRKELDKNTVTKLNKLNDAIDTNNKLSKERAKQKGSSSFAEGAKDIAKALFIVAGSIVVFIGAFALATNVLGISPFAVLGFILATTATLALSMAILSGAEAGSDAFLGKKLGVKSDNNRNKRAVQNAKDMGFALMFIAGGVATFSLSMLASKALLGVSTVMGVGIAVLTMITVLAGAMWILSFLVGKDKTKGQSKSAIQNARDMGIAMMFIAGGVLAFATTMRLVPLILGTTGNALIGVLAIVGILAAMTGIFVLLGLVKTQVMAGTATAAGIAFGMAVLSLGVLAVAASSRILSGMGDKDASRIDKDGKEIKRGKFGQLMAGMGAGLGMFGLFLLASAGTMWLLGLPPVSIPILLGAATMIAIAGSLILTAKAIGKVNDATKQYEGVDIKGNIKNMVSAVISGVTEGVMGSGIDQNNDDKLSIKEMIRFRRVMKSIRILAKIATSLSKFSMGLIAFAKVGEVADLTYNEDGTPVVGNRVTVKQIAIAIADTFGIFLKTLVEETEGLTRTQARSLKILGKALSGKKGIIAGVNEFSQTLKTYSQFGAAGEIFVPEEKDENGVVWREAANVPITTIVSNIVNSFMEFVDQIANRASEFEIAGRVGRKMVRFSEALMGQEKGFLKKAKPGILSAITAFSDTLVTYAQYGKDGMVPVRDPETGKIIKQVSIKDVAIQMVNGISQFISGFETALGSSDLEAKSKDIKKKIGSFTEIITNFDTLAQSQQGLDKLAGSMGLLATNVGLLSTNLGLLDTAKLQSLSTITVQHAIINKDLPIKQEYSAAKSSLPATQTPATSSSMIKAPEPDWDKIGDIIGQKVAEKINMMQPNSVNFRFIDWPKGQMEYNS